MSTPRENLAQIRHWIETRVLGALMPWKKFTPWKNGGVVSTSIYARAQLETSKIVEHYFYEQEISRNPYNRSNDSPVGHIELAVPYDGHDYFTRQACADVAHGIAARPGKPVTDVLIGHLLLANRENTNLDEILNLNSGYGSIPIRVPVPGATNSDGLDMLSADRQACIIAYDYTPHPDKLKLIPIRIEVDLLDPDSVDLPELNLTENPKLVNDVPSKITQQVSFRPHLLLCIKILLNIPSGLTKKHLEPQVAKISLDWPTITSMRAIHLDVGSKRHPIRYNPEKRSLEWSHVPMMAVGSPDDDDGDFRTYQSKQMYLSINQPGELYEQPMLDGKVEVEIPGCLLSGLEARLFNGAGVFPQKKQPKLTSHVATIFRLILDDAFAKRILSPYQHLYFEEIIPDAMRITDIITALKDRGFDLALDESLDNDGRFLLAQRWEGPDLMQLWLFVDGRRYETKRMNQIPGGQTFESIFESGELKVFICGTLSRDSRELTHEMNELQKALRERFERLRARR